LDYLKAHGEDEAIALALAKTFEALGSKEKAIAQYAEIMNNCQGCGRTIDPVSNRNMRISVWKQGIIPETFWNCTWVCAGNP
jgi:hypothetical protein